MAHLSTFISKIGRIGFAGQLMVAAFTAGVGIATTTTTASAAPDRCLIGYVWREAVPGDYVCVTPASRNQAQHDNARAHSRINPAGGAYGPFTCREGYVWREATGPSDKVCVRPHVREMVQRENAIEHTRRNVRRVYCERSGAFGINCR